jgi:Na+-transporting NADH:ubiquinone oxidoreductase subunit NqrB
LGQHAGGSAKITPRLGGNMSDRATAVIAAVVAAFLGMFFTRYMVSGHTELLVEVLIAQFIGNGLLAAILVTLLIR